jgi:hypothetical protein
VDLLGQGFRFYFNPKSNPIIFGHETESPDNYDLEMGIEKYTLKSLETTYPRKKSAL